MLLAAHSFSGEQAVANLEKVRQQTERLGKEGVTSVLIEGGGQVNASALKARIVDKVMFFVAPLLLGGNGAVSAIGGPGVKTLKQAFRLQQFSLTPVGDDWMAEGYL